MKKFNLISLFIVLLFIFNISHLFAQGLTRQGLKGGVNLATFTGDDVTDEDKEFRIGFIGGWFLTYRFNQMFAFQPEVLYSMQGVKYHDEYNGDSYESMAKIDYLQVPLLVKINLALGNEFNPNIIFGPFFSLKLSSKYHNEINGEVDEGEIEDIKETDFGLVLGGGFDIGALSIEGRYNLGFTNIYEQEDLDVKNSVITIMLGYSLGYQNY